jgi:hypothetical protein
MSTDGSDDLTYALGSTNVDHERLIRQATIFNSITERLLSDAGVGPGQRVLDIGSGLGDVSMLVARMVGPSGQVVGLGASESGRHRRARLPGRSLVAEKERDCHYLSFTTTSAYTRPWITALRCRPSRATGTIGAECVAIVKFTSASPTRLASAERTMVEEMV